VSYGELRNSVPVRSTRRTAGQTTTARGLMLLDYEGSGHGPVAEKTGGELGLRKDCARTLRGRRADGKQSARPATMVDCRADSSKAYARARHASQPAANREVRRSSPVRSAGRSPRALIVLIRAAAVPPARRPRLVMA
jgi:hypothetical protein